MAWRARSRRSRPVRHLRRILQAEFDSIAQTSAVDVGAGETQCWLEDVDADDVHRRV
jgi:hypothetical protein